MFPTKSAILNQSACKEINFLYNIKILFYLTFVKALGFRGILSETNSKISTQMEFISGILSGRIIHKVEHYNWFLTGVR